MENHANRQDSESLFACSTAETITLYWDKPKASDRPFVYQIRVSDRLYAEVSRTHCTLTDLLPNTVYDITVCQAETKLGRMQVKTLPKRKRLIVTDFGAVGDGKTLNTAALQAAIDHCGPGEEVYLPAGIYRTGALNLHSDMAMYLAKGAVLQGSEDPADYMPRIWSRFEGIEQECYRSLLNAGTLDHTSGPNCQNILLYGQGTISGGGRVLAQRMIESERDALKAYLADNAALVATCENENTIPGRVRGRLINLSNCAHVRITGLTLQNGASWNVHMVYCDDIVTDHCTLRSAGIWNGDGWDPDSSTNCTLFATIFDTGDDSVAIKSGKNPQGNEIARPTKDIRVFDCKSLGGNGICIGSEMSGGVEDVQIWDCDIARSSNGMEIKGTPKRGGYVRNVTVRDCRFPRLLIHTVPYNDDGVPAPQPPVFENYLFERLHLTGQRWEHSVPETVAPLEIRGFTAAGHEVRKVVCKDLVLPPETILHLARCRELTLENLCMEDTL